MERLLAKKIKMKLEIAILWQDWTWETRVIEYEGPFPEDRIKESAPWSEEGRTWLAERYYYFVKNGNQAVKVYPWFVDHKNLEKQFKRQELDKELQH